MTDNIAPVPENTNPPSTRFGDFWFALRHTPVRDVLRCRLTSRLSMTDAIAWAELPPELATVVQTVSHQTRLWWSERLDVARELAGHFRDGLDASATPAKLIESFGDQRQASAMIRRARIRCRSRLWHAWVYSIRATSALFGLLLAVYLVLAARFFSSHPTITRHYSQELNAAAKGVAEDDRAWPFYRDALMKLSPYPDNIHNGWWGGEKCLVPPDSPHWRNLLAYVEANQEPLRLIREGATKPKLGFVFGDPHDRDFLQREFKCDSIEQAPHETLIALRLPHIQTLRSLSQLLSADARVAIERREGDRLAADLQGIISLAEHSHPDPIVIETLVAYAIFFPALNLTRDVLQDRPDLLTDAQWVDLAHRLASFDGGGTLRPKLVGERMMLEDILQRCFTDDGHGDGHLTPEGWKLLLNIGETESLNRIKDPSLVALAKAAGPGALLVLAGRREMREFATNLFDATETAYQGPLNSWAASDPITERLREVRDSTRQNLRYMPVMMLMPSARQIAMSGERSTQLRDGTLTAITLELFRRKQGKWPEALDELVPHYLPELSLDRFTGKPLRYHVKDGQPVVYACGQDQQDDGGRYPKNPNEFQSLVMTKPQSPPAPGQGYDWVLFPRPRFPVPEGE